MINNKILFQISKIDLIGLQLIHIGEWIVYISLVFIVLKKTRKLGLILALTGIVAFLVGYSLCSIPKV